MAESFEVSKVLPVTPDRLFASWLDAAEHARFTGSPASGSGSLGGTFNAWDGYIEAKNLELDPPRRIVQGWRTSEFPTGAPDSRLELTFEAVEGGTRLTLRHSDIPDGQADNYRQGWADHYFQPMEAYFMGGAGNRFKEAGVAISAAADTAAQAVGEAVSEAGEQARTSFSAVKKTARKAGTQVKKTARKAASAVRKLVARAKQKLARKPAKKAAPAKKAPARKAKPARAKAGAKKKPAAKKKR